MDVLNRHRVAIGRFAWWMAWVGLVGGQLHALSRFATDDGKDDLALPLTAAWAVPAADLLDPLLSWSDPVEVYLSYGKLWFSCSPASRSAPSSYEAPDTHTASRSGPGGSP